MDVKPIIVLVVAVCACALLIAGLAAPGWGEAKSKKNDACDKCKSSVSVGLFDIVSSSKTPMPGCEKEAVDAACKFLKEAEGSDIKKCSGKCDGDMVTFTTTVDRKKSTKAQEAGGKKCKKPEGAQALLIIAFVLVLVAGILAIVAMALSSASGIIYIVATVLAIIAFIAALISVIIGIVVSKPKTGCTFDDKDIQKAAEEAFDTVNTQSIGAGGILGIVGLILTFIVMVLLIVITIMSRGGKVKPAGSG